MLWHRQDQVSGPYQVHVHGDRTLDDCIIAMTGLHGFHSGVCKSFVLDILLAHIDSVYKRDCSESVILEYSSSTQAFHVAPSEGVSIQT
jgi:hypothetical protein